ncbi:Sporulation-like domain containing protein [Burkholderiaceae bacterium]
MSAARPARPAQTGKTSALTGFVVGLLTGLILALVVALYVSRVPVPFMDRGVSRNAEADKAETERNKNWNPNAAMNKATGAPAPAAAPASEAAVSAPGANDPLGQLVESKTAPAAAGAERFAVQAGAFAAEADAQTQRARLVLLGVEAQVVAADQNGKTVFRVRTAPLDQRFQAEALQDQLKAAGVESSLVRIPR